MPPVPAHLRTHVPPLSAANPSNTSHLRPWYPPPPTSEIRAQLQQRAAGGGTKKLTLGMLAAAPNSQYRISSFYRDGDYDPAAAEPVSPLSPLLNQLREAASRSRGVPSSSDPNSGRPLPLPETPVTPISAVSAVSGRWRSKRKTVLEAVSGWWDLNLLSRQAVAQRQRPHMKGWI
ncbi:hypothetical protein CFIMG_005965RA [Ceratocystis fimbriata CBS 114723]|uniref:Uncharacterized protein n=1 Tax=Ceratocystis fimbriata CBS 114723 TaxID=1035309 RepID=A0A2C5WWD8_9PEZI|nr:hypothetical protein CFIMG_005965RA [Ceratocystis fimbriata CBS 114723]